MQAEKRRNVQFQFRETRNSYEILWTDLSWVGRKNLKPPSSLFLRRAKSHDEDGRVLLVNSRTCATLRRSDDTESIARMAFEFALSQFNFGRIVHARVDVPVSSPSPLYAVCDSHRHACRSFVTTLLMKRESEPSPADCLCTSHGAWSIACTMMRVMLMLDAGTHTTHTQQ